MNKKLIISSLLGLASVNALAYMHARRFTHFTKQGKESKSFEDMGLIDKARLLLTGYANPKLELTSVPSQTHETIYLETRQGQVLEAWHFKAHSPEGTVLLFHGFTTNKEQILPEALFFIEQGYEVFMIDFVGHGSSDGYQTTIGYHEAEDVLAAYNYIKSNTAAEKILLYGVSMGSAAILRAVATYGIRADALILECPFGTLHHAMANRFKILKMPTMPFVELMLFWASVQTKAKLFRHRPIDYAKYIQTPTLLMQGTHDLTVSQEETEAIFKGFRGFKRIHYFEGLKHESYCQNTHEEWVGVVNNFLASL